MLCIDLNLPLVKTKTGQIDRESASYEFETLRGQFFQNIQRCKDCQPVPTLEESFKKRQTYMEFRHFVQLHPGRILKSGKFPFLFSPKKSYCLWHQRHVSPFESKWDLVKASRISQCGSGVLPSRELQNIEWRVYFTIVIHLENCLFLSFWVAHVLHLVDSSW